MTGLRILFDRVIGLLKPAGTAHPIIKLIYVIACLILVCLGVVVAYLRVSRNW